MFGTFTAYLASLFLAPEGKGPDREIAELRSEVRELREILLEQRANRTDA